MESALPGSDTSEHKSGSTPWNYCQTVLRNHTFNLYTLYLIRFWYLLSDAVDGSWSRRGDWVSERWSDFSRATQLVRDKAGFHLMPVSTAGSSPVGHGRWIRLSDPFLWLSQLPQKIYKKVSKFKTSFGQPPTWPCAYCSIHHFFSPSSFSILLSPIALLRSCLPAKWGPLLNVSQNKRPCFPTGRSKQATLSLLSNTDRGFRKCQLSLSCMSMCMSISLHFSNTFLNFYWEIIDLHLK